MVLPITDVKERGRGGQREEQSDLILYCPCKCLYIPYIKVHEVFHCTAYTTAEIISDIASVMCHWLVVVNMLSQFSLEKVGCVVGVVRWEMGGVWVNWCTCEWLLCRDGEGWGNFRNIWRL